VDALFHAGISVAMVNATRVRQFARASGLLAKTNKLDAQLLAVFGQRMQPKRYEGKSEAEKQLSALLVRRKQLEEMLKAEQNRLRTISSSLRGSVERMIAMLKEEKKSLEEQIEQFLKEQKDWQEQREILSSAPGVGKVTNATLLADLPELGKMDRKTKGGRTDVRSVLYMPTLVATRYNPVIQAQYQQLLKRGKVKKVALTACMRKFLTILNTMMRDQQPFHV